MASQKTFELQPPSAEQKFIIQQLIKNNVSVQAVAGSGKTTTSLHIAHYFDHKKILLLTYNRKLSLETKAKIKVLNIKNLDVYTFHAFSAKTWQRNCQTDMALIEIINSNLEPLTLINYDLIIIDEAQDINPIFYEILCKIITTNKKKATLCILGDKNQSIYGYQKSDSRYLAISDKVFNFNDLSWAYCKLSQSFRVNQPMVDFINEVFFNEKIMYSKIENKEKIDYIVTDPYNSPELVEKILELIKKYGKENVFLLAPGIKSDKSPIKKIANKLSDSGILIYAPANDDEELDPKEMINKLCLSTFHKAKGLERSAVVVFGFDMGYFKYYGRDDNPLVINNPFYVAISRALKKLIIVHNIKFEALPFINKTNIKKTTNFKIFGNTLAKIKFQKIFNKNFEAVERTDSHSIAVTKLLRFLPSDILSFCKKLIDIKKIKSDNERQKQRKLFKIPSKLELQRNGEKYQENVSPISGTAIILNYEKVSNNGSAPLKFLLNEAVDNYEKTKNDAPMLLKNMDFLEELTKSEKWTINQTLRLAALWNYFMDGYNAKLNQIPKENFDWIKAADFETANSLIKNLLISEKANFEVRIEKSGTAELFNKNLVGFIDCIDWEKQIIWEFKFVDNVKQEHFLQLALYAYLTRVNEKFNDKEFQYFIYNIKKDQLFELKVSSINLIKIVEKLILWKVSKKDHLSDNEFLENTFKIQKKYKKKKE